MTTEPTERGSATLSEQMRATGGNASDCRRDSVTDEVAITRTALRPGGWIGYGDDAIYVDRDDERIRIESDAVTGIALQTVEWDLVVMSLLLVGVGGYVGIARNPLVGIGFALVGVLSLYRSYEKRHRLVIQVENRPKPTVVYPEHPAACHETLVDRVGLERLDAR